MLLLLLFLAFCPAVASESTRGQCFGPEAEAMIPLLPDRAQAVEPQINSSRK